MTESTATYLDDAVEILENVRGNPQTLSERKKQAIELAALMLREAGRTMTAKERSIREKASRLLNDPVGKAFVAAVTDQCFRSVSNLRTADQMIYLISQFGIPQYLEWTKRMQLITFKTLGPGMGQFSIPLAKKELRQELSHVILPGEKTSLSKHLQMRKGEKAKVNLNRLGEAVLSEAEANRRIHLYLEDLKNPEIDCISVKISTLYSQINLLAFDESVEVIADKLRELYRAAMKREEKKFITLDMEEYRGLHLTVTVFRKILDEPEFHHYSAGIALQAYLPDSIHFQKELTEWAKQRIKNGGAPIKIRLVKGANLAMEQVEASLKGWPQAPYLTKGEVDANYKRMILYGFIPENARAVHIGIGSHNLFDIAFALLLRQENLVDPYVGFEMLEGMAEPMHRVVQELSGDMLLYCPTATKEDFPHAITYLIRRLDENTSSENFLRYVFGLKPGTEAWETQATLFSQSCEDLEEVPLESRRTQNRLLHPTPLESSFPFENEPDTDFSLAQNRKWIKEIVNHWKNYKPSPIPLVIGGKEFSSIEEGIGWNPSHLKEPLYTYAKANKQEIDEAFATAKLQEEEWAQTTVQHRRHLLSRAAEKLRERRGELIGAMMIDTGKTVAEADPEVSEAIDFAEYYRRQIEKITQAKDIRWEPKGTVVVISPWNFPCSIPAGGIFAALATGNCVIFKPASEAVLVAWHLVNAIWDAGIPKTVLQFVPCPGEGAGTELVRDPRADFVVLTGSTSTALRFLKLRPGLDLSAETGGKNAIIVTSLSDREQAIKDIIQSAFSHSGQKCSAASLAILKAEVYDDPHFLHNLREAAKSLKVGLATDLATSIGPLIQKPKDSLLRALTTLEPGEEWLLKPRQDPDHPNLWSPGIKLGVRVGSYTHKTKFFGPVLGLIRADNFHHAIHIANGVPYGLTTGLHSLDEREQAIWIQQIEAGNLYINRTITGAVVRRQPFGGWKASCFGAGAKAGGPNYPRQFMRPFQIGLPREKYPVNEWVNSLTAFLDKIDLNAEQLGLWTASVANYAYWWKRLRQDRDPTKIVGQDNYFRYLPRKGITVRLEDDSSPLDALRSAAAALTCGAQFEISWSPQFSKHSQFNWLELVPVLRVVEESESQFLERVRSSRIQRVRLFESPSPLLLAAAAESATYVISAPVLANGRLELLHYTREISVCIDYHRYGNLGMREGELRKPVL